MSLHKQLNAIGARLMKFGVSLAHSLFILLAFWLALDLMQSHVVRKPVTPVQTITATPVPKIHAHITRVKAPVVKVKRVVKSLPPPTIVAYCDARGGRCG